MVTLTTMDMCALITVIIIANFITLVNVTTMVALVNMVTELTHTDRQTSPAVMCSFHALCANNA